MEYGCNFLGSGLDWQPVVDDTPGASFSESELYALAAKNLRDIGEFMSAGLGEITHPSTDSFFQMLVPAVYPVKQREPSSAEAARAVAAVLHSACSVNPSSIMSRPVHRRAAPCVHRNSSTSTSPTPTTTSAGTPSLAASSPPSSIMSPVESLNTSPLSGFMTPEYIDTYDMPMDTSNDGAPVSAATPPVVPATNFQTVVRAAKVPRRNHNHISVNVRPAPYTAYKPQAAAPSADLNGSNTRSTGATLVGNTHEGHTGGVASRLTSAAPAATNRASSSSSAPATSSDDDGPPPKTLCPWPNCVPERPTKRSWNDRPVFASGQTLARHIIKFHSEEDILKVDCPICGQELSRKDALKNHLKWCLRLAKERKAKAKAKKEEGKRKKEKEGDAPESASSQAGQSRLAA
ncbi:unnamed protein product [Peniophora sp. CBMAI 1063]|nr:unnamed protein product [Peniophora sp. CBMAI 1063]